MLVVAVLQLFKKKMRDGNKFCVRSRDSTFGLCITCWGVWLQTFI